MLLNYQDLSPVKKSIEVEIPSDLISSESRRVADEFRRQAKIPGFRPGKVPAQVVRTRFAKEIQDEVMSRLLPLTFRDVGELPHLFVLLHRVIILRGMQVVHPSAIRPGPVAQAQFGAEVVTNKNKFSEDSIITQQPRRDASEGRIASMKHVGRGVPGLPNRQLVSGHGTFVADITLPEMCAMAVLRSPYAAARILSIETARAMAEPGVLYVLTGEEIARETNPIPPAADPGFYGGKSLAVRALPTDRARYVGEPVAVVVAEDRYTAHRALDLVDVVYEELPVVHEAEAALERGSPLVEPTWGDNVMIHKEFTQGDARRVLRAAGERVVRGVAKAQRYVAAPIEPRAYAAAWDPYAEELTVWSSTQNPHPLRVFLAETLGVPETTIRVIQPHVGGGFGQKVPTFPEEVIVAYLARKLARPIKWIEERTEHFLAGGHAREERLTFEAAYEPDGRVTALDWGALAYAIVGPLLVTNVLWFTAIRRVGPSRATLFANLQPFLAVLFAVVLLSEGLGALQVAGGVFIGAGILIGRIRPTRPDPVPSPAE